MSEVNEIFRLMVDHLISLHQRIQSFGKEIHGLM